MCHILLRWTPIWAYSDSKSHTCGVVSPVTHMHCFGFFLWRQQVTGRVETFLDTYVVKVIIIIIIITQCPTHMFDEELRKVFVVFETFLQLSYKETDRVHRETVLMVTCKQDNPLREPLLSFPPLDTNAGLTLYASRRSGGCSRRRFCLFLSCHQGRLSPRSSSWSPAGSQHSQLVALPTAPHLVLKISHEHTTGIFYTKLQQNSLETVVPKGTKHIHPHGCGFLLPCFYLSEVNPLQKKILRWRMTIQKVYKMRSDWRPQCVCRTSTTMPRSLT